MKQLPDYANALLDGFRCDKSCCAPSRKWTWLLLVLLSCTVSSCYLSAVNELKFTREQPALTNIVGTWFPTQDTLADMKRLGGYSISTHALTLSSNGYFWLTNMPDWWTNGFGSSSKSFHSGGGAWELSVHTNGWNPAWMVDLKFTNATGGIEWIVSIMHVYRQKPPYLLHFPIGDPDGGQAMYFERKGDNDSATNSNHKATN